MTQSKVVEPKVETKQTQGHKVGFKDWELESAIYSLQVDKDQAGYLPLGMHDDMACATCNWFVSPDQCLLVWGDISPTGFSDLWMKKKVWAPEPLEVVIVGSIPSAGESALKEGDKSYETKKSSMVDKAKSKMGQKSIINLLVSGVKNIFSSGAMPQYPPVQREAVQFIKVAAKGTAEGAEPASMDIRFFLWGSNNFKDRESEIFEEAAHKEFISWADENNLYPELWLWHSKGLSLGTIDWMDYADGFLVASGLVAKDKEYIIENLQANGEALGVSHGYIYSGSKNVVTQYRSWEFSLLPLTKAANSWTNFAALKEEAEMPFTVEKKAWLKDVAGIDDDTITSMETQTKALSDGLKSLGIEFKELDDLPEGSKAGTKEEPAGEAAVQAQLQPMVAAINTLTGVVAGLAEHIATSEKSVEEKLEAAMKSDDEKIADALTNKLAKMKGGFEATSSKETVVDGKDAQLKETDNWWLREVMAPLTGAKS